MSSTLLEVTRAAHEDVERLERLVVKELQKEPANNRERLFQNHRVRHMIDLIRTTTDKLVEIYEDKDNARKDEIAALGAGGPNNCFPAFYDRLKEIRDYHRRHPAARVVDVNEEFEELLKEEPQIEFSGEALAARGLKTGGTLRQRAERLFLTKYTPLEQLDRKHFAKGSRGSEQNGVAEETNSKKEIALLEAKMQRLCELLKETIIQTTENVIKKQALTYEEMEAEREEEEVQADTESDDEEQQIYNPLKLPMGWDGKPIPYWLYKLHGLGQGDWKEAPSSKQPSSTVVSSRCYFDWELNAQISRSTKLVVRLRMTLKLMLKAIEQDHLDSFGWLPFNLASRWMVLWNVVDLHLSLGRFGP
ncbi:hypothetical protein COCNU_14G000230 [Cocos nucifera]|uniref:Uncharacterized protein n=1 Tax=Cocos nucifera TaxID=13894 RepID=A0A8K0NCG0_COCNU|nr:hypothetical protein COCNU_14G000230 [Cocos nucifera]